MICKYCKLIFFIVIRWVTALVSGNAQKENEDNEVLVSGSRDHSVITWALYKSP